MAVKSDIILEALKASLGIPLDVSNFDEEIIMNANAAFSTLRQLGVGPKEGFRVSDGSETWSSLELDKPQESAARDYIYLKTKLQFDPPSNGFLVTPIQDQIKELEFRMNLDAEGAFDD